MWCSVMSVTIRSKDPCTIVGLGVEEDGADPMGVGACYLALRLVQHPGRGVEQREPADARQEGKAQEPRAAPEIEDRLIRSQTDDIVDVLRNSMGSFDPKILVEGLGRLVEVVDRYRNMPVVHVELPPIARAARRPVSTQLPRKVPSSEPLPWIPPPPKPAVSPTAYSPGIGFPSVSRTLLWRSVWMPPRLLRLRMNSRIAISGRAFGSSIF